MGQEKSVEFVLPGMRWELSPEKGTWNLFSMVHPRCVIKNASAAVKIGKKWWKSKDHKCDITQSAYQGELGQGTRYRIDVLPQLNSETPEPVHFQWDLVVYCTPEPLVTLESIITNRMDTPLPISFLSPLGINVNENGGVFIGQNPDAAAIFENGLTHTMEFIMRGITAREESDSMYMQLIYSKPDLKENLLIGQIDKPENLTEVISNDEESEGLEEDGREGIAEWRAQKSFPKAKSLPPGDTLSSGVWVIMVDVPDGFTALEKYALVVQKYNRIRIWPYEVPHGWNSWCNPLAELPGTYYSTDINEQIILDNMDVAIKHLKPFGLKYWQLDNGYSLNKYMTVDEIAQDRFPHGMKWLADQIHNAGLRAGIWINPFNVGTESYLVTLHKKDGWFPEKDPSFPIHDSWLCLDLTIPEVQDYIRHVVRKVTKEWGYDLLKVDFTYLVMAPSQYANKSMTAAEVQRLGYNLIREAAGEDVFIFGIGGPIGVHLGSVDGERVSLDTLPKWRSASSGMVANGVVPSYITFSRRYFYHNRIFFNHLDCLSFRATLQPNESMCLATAIGLLGGIWKIGDKLVDMSPNDLATCQKLLPIWRQGARPLDLFRRAIPEILDLSLEHAGIAWHVLGLFNWGENQDILADTPLPDAPRTITVEFSELDLAPEQRMCHVFDFWAHRYLGIMHERLALPLEPHHSCCVSVHPVKNHPQLISSNRHITQGAVEIDSVGWIAPHERSSGLFSCQFHVVPTFQHILTFAAPVGWTVNRVELAIGPNASEPTSAIEELSIDPYVVDIKISVPKNWPNETCSVLIVFDQK
jgi:hypothetical protein